MRAYFINYDYYSGLCVCVRACVLLLLLFLSGAFSYIFQVPF